MKASCNVLFVCTGNFARSILAEATMDLIITVWDRAAGEPCPIWPGHPETARWSVPDSSRATGSHDERRAAFKEALHILQNRITLLLSLPSLEPLTIQTRLDQDAFTGRPSSP